jgi:Rnl2 family RNA ligase
MRFRAYPKIGGRAESVGGPWVATEKLHGANFVVGHEAATGALAYGKRKAWLAPDEPFFGWQILARELDAPLRALATELAAPHVVCFGELFGGAYPHPDVAPVPGLSAVQTGIWYTPELRWAVFDILVATGDDDDGELLAFAEVEALAHAAGVLVPPVLARVRHGELDRVAIAAPTEVPARLGLPPIAGNLREGFVAKPDRRLPYGSRPIVKRKLADFDDARFDAGEAWDPGHLSVDELVAWAGRLVNPARVASARSKVGVAPAAIVDEIVLDVAVDLETVFAAAWRDLGAAGETAVLDHVRAAAIAIVTTR